MDYTIGRKNVASLSLALRRMAIATSFVHQNFTYSSLPGIFHTDIVIKPFSPDSMVNTNIASTCN